MTTVSIPTVRLPSGRTMPKFGLGTWRMGESARKRRDEVDALRHGIGRGVTLMDSAEMYGDGEAERILADAAGNDRERLFIVSKVLPENASRRGTIAACERSLKRLKTDRIDLYLLHWRGSVPLAETLEAFATLRDAGKIIDWGVSNFDMSDMQELAKLSPDEKPATDQVLYNLTRRGIAFDLVPWCRARKIPIMAYSPIEQGRVLSHPALKSVAQRRGATPAQIALAWLLRQEGIIVIPKAGSRAHVEEDIAALELTLDKEDLAALDRAFPPPTKAKPLEML
ncbi:MAG TPA: aldo/keto reductase [Pseudolabrys sp.]|nr:aldo/keto reductase [Pseudolabrys sp.]